MPTLRIHIGHHFFGSGNVGDDLMLAGFLEAARPAFVQNATFTCCTPHDAASQRRRFPAVEWLPYDDSLRSASIARCDVWLGLGGTPFQATDGRTWFLDHLCQEADWCRQYGVPMYYLGVGINERAAVSLPQTRRLAAQAERIWMRDADAAGMLDGLARPGRITAHADLAHLALATMRFPDPEPGTLGLVLNFEDPKQYHPDGLAALVQGAQAWRPRWLAQEIRSLAGAETFLHALLPPEARAQAPLRAPDYARAASVRDLLTGWEGLDALFTSRYHAALIGAWTGARVAVFARNDKVAGAARQLGLSTVPVIGDTPAVFRALQEARPVERARLLGLAGQAREACEDFFACANAPSTAASSPPVESPPVFSHPPARLLILRPDAYGDLVLFEPVLRLVRDAWPETEIAVLIRQSCQDAAPLFTAGGVRWLTTECNPYRESPGAHPAALAALRETVRGFAPDCLVAACAEQTWLEAAVASFLPEARQIGLGDGLTNPLARAALDAALPVDWSAIYREKVPVEMERREWEKNLCLAGALLGREVPRWWPVAQVPEVARERAAQVLSEAGLSAGAFAVCAAAGTANVQIKGWPAAHYGHLLAWLERERGIRALLIGHASEREPLEAVRQSAGEGGAHPALWTGQDGEMPVVAGLLQAAGFYFGNDTGALHLAAALGRPVAAVFGGGTWPRFRPVARRSAVVVQPLPCFGCGWNCYFGDAPCIREIPPAAVRQALAWLLASDEEGSRDFTVEDAIPPEALQLIRGTAAALRPPAGSPGAGEPSQKALADLFKQLHFSEADRAARLEVIEQQGAEIGRLHAEIDQQLKASREFWPRLDAAEAERSLMSAQLADLQGHYENVATDSAARLQVIDQQGAELGRLHAQWDAARNERNLLAAQLADLQGHFDNLAADSAARLEVIEQQGAEIGRLHAEVDQQLKAAREFWPELETAKNGRDLLAAQIEDWRRHFESSEADRAARLEVIHRQGDEIGRLQTGIHRWQQEAEDLKPKLEEARRECSLRTTQLDDLRAESARREAEQTARVQALDADLGKMRAAHSTLASELAAGQKRQKTLERHWTARLLKTIGLWPR